MTTKRQSKSLQFVFELQNKESVSYKQTQGHSMKEGENSRWQTIFKGKSIKQIKQKIRRNLRKTDETEQESKSFQSHSESISHSKLRLR